MTQSANKWSTFPTISVKSLSTLMQCRVEEEVVCVAEGVLVWVVDLEELEVECWAEGVRRVDFLHLEARQCCADRLRRADRVVVCLRRPRPRLLAELSARHSSQSAREARVVGIVAHHRASVAASTRLVQDMVDMVVLVDMEVVTGATMKATAMLLTSRIRIGTIRIRHLLLT